MLRAIIVSICVVIAGGILTNSALAQTELAKYAGNPILDLGSPGTWDDSSVREPTVLFDGTGYKMYYTGFDGLHMRIGLATSADGILWQKHLGNPILDIGENEAWDDFHIHGPTVLFDGVEYKMWYAGHNGTNSKIGYAVSPNGVVWQKYAGNPVLDRGTWDWWDIASPTVLYDGTEYKMWFSGSNGSHYRIGYAVSPNGVVWVEHPGNPVLKLGASGTWDNKHIGQPSVLYDGTVYRMWYAGDDHVNYRIGYAVSSNGITWIKHPDNPVLDIGENGTWDDLHVYGPTVIIDNTGYKMWYHGHDGSNFRIGYASTDYIGPVTSNVQADPNPVAMNNTFGLTANVDDLTTGGSTVVSAMYRIDDGNWESMYATDESYDEASEDVYAEMSAFSEPGVHTIWVRGTDSAGNVGDPEDILLAVYDPNGGFVTGGGWIDSPEGACAADESLTGKANFGFVSKYKKGADVPTGNTQFNFRVADLNFHSDEYDWLVVNQDDSNAQYKGKGTINGELDENGEPYKFMLWAGDHDPDGDTFRIKIWYEEPEGMENLVYDNGFDQVIGGGNIKIHSGSAAAPAVPSDFALLQNYPNSFNPETWIPYRLAKDASVSIRIYNVSGRLVRTLDLGYKPAGFYTNRSKSAYWNGRNETGEQVSSGIYFYTVHAGEFAATKKMILAR